MKVANRIAGICMAVIGLTAGVALAADYRAAAAQGDIVIDGRLDEAAWQQAAPFSGFHYLPAMNPTGAPDFRDERPAHDH